MATRQYLIPGHHYQNEANTKDYLVPGQLYINETQSGNTVYSLALGSGTYVIAGQVVPLNSSRSLALGTGSYAITGQNITLSQGYKLSLANGVYNLTGNDVTLTKNLRLSLNTGTYNINGQAVTLTYTPAGVVNYSLSLGRGVYSISGQSANITLVVNNDTHDPGIKRHHIYALSDAQKKRLRDKLRKAVEKRREAREIPQNIEESLPIEEEIIEKIDAVKAALPEMAQIDFIEHFNNSSEWEQLKKALNFALKYQEEQLKIRQEEEELFLLACAIAA